MFTRLLAYVLLACFNAGSQRYLLQASASRVESQKIKALKNKHLLEGLFLAARPLMRAPLNTKMSLSEQQRGHMRKPNPNIRRQPDVFAVVSEGNHESQSLRADSIVQIDGEVCNVAVTHIKADFDSLAAAVALTKYWSITRPEVPSFVCLPTGANQQVSQYLAKHRSLIPVRNLKTLRGEDIRAVGIVDTANKARIGKAAMLLDHAEYVEVYDHHPDVCSEIPSHCNIDADKFISEPVGSATTLVVEMLRELLETQQRENTSLAHRVLTLNEAELSLFALGITTDNINMLAPSTTLRDYKALTWLVEQGASQQAISEYGNIHRSPSEDHGRKLTEALHKTSVTEYEGFRVGVVYSTFGDGQNGANLALDVLNKLNLDVLLLGVLKLQRKTNALSIIGRGSARCPVDLDVILKKYGGGGHACAASASLRWNASSSNSTESVIESWMDQMQADILSQIPKQAVAQDIMTRDVIKLEATDTMQDAMDLMSRTRIPSLPVVEGNKLVGMIKKPQVVQALRRKEADVAVRSRLHIAKCLHAGATLSEINKALQVTSTRLPVISDDKVLLGIITGTDVLAHLRLYKKMHDWHTGFSRKSEDVEWLSCVIKAASRLKRKMNRSLKVWWRLASLQLSSLKTRKRARVRRK